MKEVRIYHRKDLVETLKCAIDGNFVSIMYLTYLIGSNEGPRARIIRRFRNQFKIYECF